MPNFCTLFSGSSGNCTFVSDGKTNILIDAGVSASRILTSLGELGVTPHDIDAILITHEHRDHVSSVGILSRNYSIPVYANYATMEKTMAVTGWIFDDYINTFKSNDKFGVGDIEIFPFSISHDAIDPVGYTFRFGGKYYSIATDIGCVTESMLKHLCRSESVLIESNHDVQMLKDGPYPNYLKQRILSSKGHLSNENAAHLAAQLVKWGTKRIALGHLSEKNNTSEAAFSATAKCFEENNIEIGKDVILQVAPKNDLCQIC